MLKKILADTGRQPPKHTITRLLWLLLASAATGILVLPTWLLLETSVPDWVLAEAVLIAGFAALVITLWLASLTEHLAKPTTHKGGI